MSRQCGNTIVVVPDIRQSGSYGAPMLSGSVADEIDDK